MSVNVFETYVHVVDAVLYFVSLVLGEGNELVLHGEAIGARLGGDAKA